MDEKVADHVTNVKNEIGKIVDDVVSGKVVKERRYESGDLAVQIVNDIMPCEHINKTFTILVRSGGVQATKD